MIRPSKSTEGAFKLHQACSKDALVLQVRSLARLFAFASDERIGNTIQKDDEITVELFKGSKINGLVKVETNSRFQLLRLTITRPDGGMFRYFV